MLRRASLLLLLANAIPAWIFAQQPTHTFSSREFQYKTAATAAHPSNVLSDAFQLNITTSPATCDATNGLIILEPSGGTAPYIYSFDGGSGQLSGFFFATGGSHDIEVSDATGAVVHRNVTVPADGHMPSENGTMVQPAACDQKDGSLTISAQGGTPPYMYSLDRLNWQTSPVFNQLSDGVYQIFVKDAKDCIGPGTVYSAGYCISLGIIGSYTTCNAADGSMNISVDRTPGHYHPPYTFSLDGINYNSTGEFDNLTYGIYNIYIKDGQGGNFIYAYTLRYFCGLDLNGVVTDATCGNSDGTITVTGVNGSAPYQYSIDGLHFQTTNVFAGLTAGLYSVMVTDATGGRQRASVNVRDNCPVVLKVTATATPASCVDNDGQLLVSAQGGSAPYQYSLDEGSFGPSGSFDHLHSGDHQVAVKDAAGSIVTQTVTVHGTPPPRVFAGNDTSLRTGQPLPLHAVDVQNSGLNHWQWSPAEGLDNARVQAPIAHPTENITYTVTGSTDEGCVATAGISVKVLSALGIFVPDAFSPNGDGHNDVLRATPVGMTKFNYFAIYNRNGQRVFYTENPSNGWRGDVNGELQAPGTYIWQAAGVDNQGALVQQKGTVILLR